MENLVNTDEHFSTFEDLKVSEEKFRRIFELSPIGKSLTGIDGSLHVNKAFSEIVGYSEEELKLKNWKEITYPDDIQASVEIVNDLLDGKIDRANYQKRNMHKNGNIVWTEVFTTLFKDKDGKINSFITTIIDITERKLIEESIKIQNQKLENILGGTNAGTWDWNVQTGAVVLNERWAEIRGLTLQELEPIDINTWIDSVHPDDLPAANAALENHFKGELSYFDVEFRQPHKDGRFVWVNARGKVVEWTKDGKPLQMSGTHLDITERKLAEIMFRDEKERIRTILDMVGDPIFVKDNDHRITLANRAFYDLFGMDEKNVIGFTLVEAVPENERQQFLKVDRSVLDTGIPDMREEELTVGDHKRTIITRKKRFIDESGKIFLVGSIHDITDRKLAEDKLHETSMLLTEILNTIPIRVFWKDLESNYLGCNLPFAQDAGLGKPEEVIGKTDYQMFVTEHAENFRTDDRIVMESGIAKIGFEELQENKEGMDHWLRTNKVPLIDKTGEIIGVLGTYEDISEKKQTEVELKKYRDQLEILVQERTAELESKNKELNNAMKVFVGREITIRDLQARIKALGGKVS